MLKKIPCLACLADLFFARGGHTLESYVTNPTRADRIKCMKELQSYSLPFGALTILLLVDPPTEFCASCGLFPAVGLDAFKRFFIFLFLKGLFETNKQILSKKENLHLQGNILVTCFQSLKLPWHQRIFIWLREIHTCQQPYSHHKPPLLASIDWA